MGAVAAITSAVVGAISTGYSIHNAEVQNANAKNAQRIQKESNDAAVAMYEQEAFRKEKQQQDLQKESDAMAAKQEADSQRDISRARLKNRVAGSSGRQSTILTGPQGLVSDEPQKTILGG